MKSIKARYDKKQKQTLYLGDYINLSSAVRGQRFSRRTIEGFFGKAISPNDYLRSEKKKLIDELCKSTNSITLEANKK